MADRATIDKIADAALRVLEQEGPTAVTMRRVAAAVEITPMAIYHHFASREALLQAVTDREFGKLLSFIERRQRKTPPRSSAARILIELTEGYIDYALAHPQVFQYVFSETRPGARRFPGDFRARFSPTLNPVADCIAEGMRGRQFRKDDIWELALQSWALAHGYVVLYIAGRFSLSEKEFRALCRRATERMVNGFKTR